MKKKIPMLLAHFCCLICIINIAGCCISTGNPSHPVDFYGWRYYLYGHEKYTPEERAMSRCQYLNRLPDGSRSGFSHLCRVKATRFPMGINAAMYGELCVIEECGKAIYHIGLDPRAYKPITLTVHNSDPHDVIKWIADQMGPIDFFIASSVVLPGKISMDVKRARAATVLDNLCQSYSCRWSIEGNKLQIIPAATTIVTSATSD